MYTVFQLSFSSSHSPLFIKQEGAVLWEEWKKFIKVTSYIFPFVFLKTDRKNPLSPGYHHAPGKAQLPSVYYKALDAPCPTTDSHVDHPQNIWVILVKTLQQDSLCLYIGTVENLLSTCLVGIPLTANYYPYTGKKPNLVDTWDERTRILPHAPEEPQELDFLGSFEAIFCLQFYYRQPNQPWPKFCHTQSIYRKKWQPFRKCII